MKYIVMLSMDSGHFFSYLSDKPYPPAYDGRVFFEIEDIETRSKVVIAPSHISHYSYTEFNA